MIPRLGPDGEKLIKFYEELCLGVYHGQADAPDVWTIGWGAIRFLDGSRCVPSTPPITEPQAESLFMRDTHTPLVTIDGMVKADLEQHQIDALTAFIFNVGVTAFQHSTLLRNINRGETDRIPAQWLKWDIASGHAVGGLEKRRQKELDLFMGA